MPPRGCRLGPCSGSTWSSNARRHRLQGRFQRLGGQGIVAPLLQRGPGTRQASGGKRRPAACHVWDTIGAHSAGWQAGLILHQGNAPLGLGAELDYIGKDLNEIADQLICKYGSGAGQ